MKEDQILKDRLLNLISGKGAHVDFETAIKGISAKYYGAIVEGVPFSLWQLLEHMRLAQHDILDYIRNPNYVSPTWPEGYWPKTNAPQKRTAWSESLKNFRKDLQEIKALLADPKSNLFQQIPHGKKGHSILREILLIADHNAYHLGQLVMMRRLLGIW
jgi:uncharacterized damage-inducible protein DinB